MCAPTGAGKTNIAMMSVLHEIGANMQDGMIQARCTPHTGGIGCRMLLRKPHYCLSGYCIFESMERAVFGAIRQI